MYAKGYFPDAFRIGGMQLVPMTLGHVLLLERLESPFAPWRPTTEELGTGALVLFVGVTTRTWRDAAEVLQKASWVWEWKARRIAKSVTRDKRAAATVDAYLRSTVNVPNATHWKRDDLTATGAELSHALVVTMMQLGASREQALDTPLRVALWDQMYMQEQAGAVSLESDGAPKTEAKRKAIEDMERRLSCQTKQ